MKGLLKSRISGLFTIFMLCIMVMTIMPSDTFAAEDNCITAKGQLKYRESVTWNINLEEKSNIVLTFIEDSVGMHTLKIYDNNNKVVYQNKGFPLDEPEYKAGFLEEQPQQKTVLPKGKYRIVLKEADPWFNYNSVYYSVIIKWAPVDEVMEEMINPGKPVVKAEWNSDTGKIKLSWAAAKNADYYNIYRWTISNGGSSLIEQKITNLTYIDKTAKPGNTYVYVVSALNAENLTNAGTISEEVKCTCKLIKPTGLKASTLSTSGKIKLSWSKVTGATGYKVYRATSENGKYSLLKTVTETTYTDKSATASKKYYYKVRAITSKSSAASSAYSDKVSKLCRLGRPAVTTSNVAKSGKIKLTWKAISGADKYEIYRSTSKGGEYKRIYTTSKTSFVNNSIPVEKIYYYKVKAIDNDNASANSAYSTVSSRRCDLARPVVKLSSNRKAKLTWAKVEGAKEYKVYRATSKNGKYKAVKTVTTTTYTDKIAKKNKTYYYKVKAISGKTSSANSAYSLAVKKAAK